MLFYLTQTVNVCVVFKNDLISLLESNTSPNENHSCTDAHHRILRFPTPGNIYQHYANTIVVLTYRAK